MKKLKLLLFTLFLCLSFQMGVIASTPYEFSYELFEVESQDAIYEFLDSYQAGEAKNIPEGSMIKPGAYFALGTKYKVGVPNTAVAFQLTAKYDPTVVEPYMEGETLYYEFDNRTTNKGGVFPPTTPTGSRTNWTLGVPNNYRNPEKGEYELINTIGDESVAYKTLTHEGGILYFYFLKVKEDAPAKSPIVFEYVSTDIGSDIDSNAIIVKGIPGVYQVFGESSNDASLKTLEVKNGTTFYTLNPNFSASTTNYKVIVPNNVTSINLNATTNDANASILSANLGDKNLTVGDNEYSITTTAEDGTVVVTKVVVKRLSNNADLTNLTLSGVTLNPTFNANTLEYTANVLYSVNETTVTATSNATIKSGNGLWQLTNYGVTVNTKNIVVEAEDCKTEYSTVLGNTCTTKTYKINITRQNPSNDANLSNLKVNNVLINGFNSTTTTYNIDDVVGVVTSLNISADAANANATVTVNGNTNLTIGNNAITVVVTAEDGTTKKTYTINVKRLSNDTTLSSLNITSTPQGLLDPIFNVNTKTYTYEYDEKVANINVSATATDSNAKSVVGTGLFDISATNKTLIVVTAEDGTTDTYTVNFIRNISNVSSLSSLSVTDYTLTPTFITDTYNYELTVPNNVSQITVNATATSSHAKSIVGTGNINLEYGVNNKNVVVTAEDGKTKTTYNLKITRELNSEAKLTNIKVNNISIAGFNSTNLTYTLDDISSSLNDLTITFDKMDANANVVVTGNTNLIEGQNNVITVTSTSQDSSSIIIYTINVRRKSGIATLSNLNVVSNPQGVLTPTFNSNTKTYTFNYDSSVSSINITATATDNINAIVTGTGAIDPRINNKASIIVTPEDGTIQTYTVDFIRNKDTDSSLSNLSVEHNGTTYPLTPTFISGTLSYNVTIPNNIDEVTINASANSAFAKPLVGTGSMPLSYGSNIRNIVVTAEDGISKTTYALNITRTLSDIASLSDIKIDDVSIVDFTSNTLEYTLPAIASNKTSVNVTYTKENDNATVVVAGSTNLIEGQNNVITVKVTSQDTKKTITYTLNLYRKSSVNTLSNLTLTSAPQGTLSPVFNANTKTYTYKYDRTVSKINVLATSTNSKAIVTGLKEYNVTENSALVTVTPEDGVVNTYTISFEQVLDTDKTLSNLVVANGGSNYTLTPNFNSSTLNYTLNVAGDIDNVTITATKNSQYATVTGEGLTNLTYGTNIKNIEVTAEDGSKQVYKITITRQISSNASLTDLKIDGTTITGFANSTTTYILDNVPYSKNSIELTATGSTGTSVTGTGTKTLNVGDNEFVVIATAQDGVNKTEYKVNIRRKSNVAELTNLTANFGTITPNFNASIKTYTLTIDASVDTLDLTAIPIANARILNSNDLINIDTTTVNKVEIEVQAEDSNYIDKYIVNINKTLSDNTYLSNLIVSEGTLTPVFNKNTFAYNVTVNSNISSIIITPTKENSKAIITGDTGNLSLNYGVNNFRITVTAQDGSNNEYVVNVTRSKKNDATLSDLKINSNTVTNFLPNTTTYEETVPNGISSINITATTTDTDASIPTSQLGDKGLSVGLNTFYIMVTAQDGTIKTYTLKITREKSRDNALTNLTIYGDTPTWNSSENRYELTVENSISRLESNDITATIPTGATINKGTGISLITGDNNYSISVTAENGDIKTYNINIIKKASSNNYLSSLTVNTYTLNEPFNKDTLTYTLTVNSTVNSVIVNATKEDSKATLKMGIAGSLNIASTYTFNNLQVGTNVVIIEVISEDNTIKNYTLTITKEGTTTIDKIISDIYPIDDVYIKEVMPETSTDELKDQLKNFNEELIIYDANGTNVYTGNRMGTGMIVKLVRNGVVHDQKIVIVSGDANGDTYVDITDTISTLSHYLYGLGSASELKGAYFMAANMIKDSSIDVSDVIAMLQYYLQN